MALFYFHVRQCDSLRQDYEGTELVCETSARTHASLIAQDLLRNNEARARSWRLEVCGPDHKPCFQTILVDYDETLHELPLELKNEIRRAARGIAALASEIGSAKLNIARLMNATRRSETPLLLATSDGVRL